MEVYQITATCAECKSENKVIIADETATALCQSCGYQVIKVKRFAGVIYVMSNPKVEGVKIGMTSRNVFERAKQISGTGVPGSFSVIAAYPSNNPNKDERKVHEKLNRRRIGKEHFDLDPVTAVVRLRTILGKEWVFLDRKYEQRVAAKLADQKDSAKRRFAGGSSQAPQIELFEKIETELPSARPNVADPRSGDAPKPKRFPASLFN